MVDKFVICGEILSEEFVVIVMFLVDIIKFFWFLVIGFWCWICICGIYLVFMIFCVFRVEEVFCVVIEMFLVVIIVLEVVIVLGKDEVDIEVIFLFCGEIFWIVDGIFFEMVFWRICVVEICLDFMICCWRDLFDRVLVDFVVIVIKFLKFVWCFVI